MSTAVQVIANEEQARKLEEHIGIIRSEAIAMRKCLKTNRLLEAFKHASLFLGELRTSFLSPKQYYELYVVIYDELDFLSEHLKRKKNLADLYELVQYAGKFILIAK